MNVKEITSSQNPVFKDAVKKQQLKAAKAAGVFTVEGVRAVDEAIESGTQSRDASWEIESLWLSASFAGDNPGYAADLTRTKVPVYQVPDPLFRRLADTEHPQGVIGILKRQNFSLEEVFQSLPEHPLVVVLENLQDPGNVGTILRTADAAGADAIFCTKGTCDVYSPKVVRSSMGSLLHVPVIPIPSVEALKVGLMKKGIRLLAAHLMGEKAPWEADLSLGVALLIGNEGAGLSKEAAQAADLLVKIPMPGQAESLNAGIAAGMLLYEAIRQRSSCQL